jgi:hypothetical protein
MLAIVFSACPDCGHPFYCAVSSGDADEQTRRAVTAVASEIVLHDFKHALSRTPDGEEILWYADITEAAKNPISTRTIQAE